MTMQLMFCTILVILRTFMEATLDLFSQVSFSCRDIVPTYPDSLVLQHCTVSAFYNDRFSELKFGTVLAAKKFHADR
jgi:hypothetical protein